LIIKHSPPKRTFERVEEEISRKGIIVNRLAVKLLVHDAAAIEGLRSVR